MRKVIRKRRREKKPAPNQASIPNSYTRWSRAGAMTRGIWYSVRRTTGRYETLLKRRPPIYIPIEGIPGGLSWGTCVRRLRGSVRDRRWKYPAWQRITSTNEVPNPEHLGEVYSGSELFFPMPFNWVIVLWLFGSALKLLTFGVNFHDHEHLCAVTVRIGIAIWRLGGWGRCNNSWVLNYLYAYVPCPWPGIMVH